MVCKFWKAIVVSAKFVVKRKGVLSTLHNTGTARAFTHWTKSESPVDVGNEMEIAVNSGDFLLKEILLKKMSGLEGQRQRQFQIFQGKRLAEH